MKSFEKICRVIRWTGVLGLTFSVAVSAAPAFGQSWPNERVYSQSMKSTVWIRSDQGFGSGAFLAGEVILSEKLGDSCYKQARS